MAAPIYDPFSWNAPGNTLQDLYNWYQTGGDEDTTGTISTGGITNAYYPQRVGGGGDGGGANYVPDYGNPYYMEDDEADPFFMQRDDPNLLERFGTRVRDFVGGIPGAFPFSIPNILNRVTGRPVDAIHSYSGDVTGYGSRGALTQEEVRNMKLVELMGGADDMGKDIYGINVVSGFGDYTKYRENRQTELEDQFEKSKDNWTKKHGSLKTKNKFGKTWEEMNKHNLQEYADTKTFNTAVEEDENETLEEIQKINKMKKFGYITKKDKLGYITKKDDVIPTVSGTAANEDIGITPTVLGTAANEAAYTTPTVTYTSPAYTGGVSGVHTGEGGGGGSATPGSMGMSTIGGGDPFFNKGGRVRYAKGGIVDLL